MKLPFITLNPTPQIQPSLGFGRTYRGRSPVLMPETPTKPDTEPVAPPKTDPPPTTPEPNTPTTPTHPFTPDPDPDPCPNRKPDPDRRVPACLHDERQISIWA